MPFWKKKPKVEVPVLKNEFSIKFTLEPESGNVSIICNWPKPGEQSEDDIAHKFAMLIASCSSVGIAEFIQQAVTQQAVLMGFPDMASKIIYFLTTLPMGNKQPVDSNPDAPVIEPIRVFRRD
jgi:hypothetical protein